MLRRTLATVASDRPQNLIEKIVQRYAVDLSSKTYKVAQGDFVSIQPEHVMTHDNTAAVLLKFESIGAGKFFNNKQPVFTLDHNIQDTTAKNLAKYDTIAKFAAKHNVDFFPAGRGIGHQIVVEEGYAFPYTLTVASDSHSNMYGGIGALGTPIVRTDAAAIWATGRTWWQIPKVAKVELLNKLPAGVTGKDVIITLCGIFNNDQVLNHAVEFTGNQLEFLSIDERLSIANMTTEWGALAGVFPVDNITIEWLKKRAEILNSPTKIHPRINMNRIKNIQLNPLNSDTDANYSKHLTLDLSSVSPYISGPNSVKVATSLSELEKKQIPIQKAYVVSCVNSRAQDLREAAKIMKGRKVAEGVEFYVAPASTEVLKEATDSGDWKTLLEAGCIPLPAGCGPCIGLGAGLLKDGEVGISATNRNFKGRMGSPLAQAYLASPAVVAASAVVGKIASPASLAPLNQVSVMSATPIASCVELPEAASTQSSASSADSIPGFPSKLKGEIVFCDIDNMNTDGIYPGKYTYREDLTPSEMAEVAMENYDPEFSKTSKKTDILISGYNFGTGSSREQAATALKYFGIPIVIAGSFSETYKRNAINNALIVAECPKIVNDLRASKKEGAGLTWRTGWNAEIDLLTGNVQISKTGGENATYSIAPVGKAAQEIVVVDGLENWVRARI